MSGQLGVEMRTGDDSQLNALGEWQRYGSIIPACVVGMSLLAIHVYAIGVLMEPLQQEFGWSRAEISAGPLVTALTTLSLASFAGRKLDSLGPRKIALVGVPVFAAALALLSITVNSLAVWLGLYMLLAAASMLVFPTVWTGAVAMRFDKSRGLAMAVVLSGTGIASAAVPYLTAELLQNFGWRGAYIGLGAISFVVVYPLVLWLFDRDDTHQRHLELAAQSPQNEKGASEFRSPRYLRLAAAALIYSVGATGLAVNAVPILMEEGFSLAKAAGIVSLIGIGTIVGRAVGGALLDIFDGRLVATCCGLAAVLAAATLLLTDQSPLAASVACFLLGLAAGAEFDACAYLTTRYFPRHKFGALFGVIGALCGVGAGFSPMIANAVYDYTGSYNLVLIGIVPLFAIASALFLSLGRYPEHV